MSSTLKALMNEKNKRAGVSAATVSDTEALVKKMATLESNLRSLQKERDEWKGKYDSHSTASTQKDIREELYKVAAAAGAVDPEDVYSRFIGKTKKDGDRVFIDGSEKTLSEDISEFLASKPHLIRAPAAEQRPGASPYPASAKSEKVVDVRTNEGATEYARSFMPPGFKS